MQSQVEFSQTPWVKRDGHLAGDRHVCTLKQGNSSGKERPCLDGERTGVVLLYPEDFPLTKGFATERDIRMTILWRKSSQFPREGLGGVVWLGIFDLIINDKCKVIFT